MADEGSETINMPKYMALLQKISNRQVDTILIELDDLKIYYTQLGLAQGGSQNRESSLLSNVNEIVRNTTHFIELFSQVVDDLMPQPTVDIDYETSTVDIILSQRRQRNENVQADLAARSAAINSNNPYGVPNLDVLGAGVSAEVAAAMGTDEMTFPPQLTRRYHLYIKPPGQKSQSYAKALAVREIRAEYIGHLITIKGIVTRVSDVKPSVEVNAYTCDTCGAENFQEVKGRSFTPLIECHSPECISNKSRGKLFLSTRASKFSAFQEARIQEMSNQVPIGHIPRNISVHLTGTIVRQLSPGDVVQLSGIFTPTPMQNGWRTKGRGNPLLTDTFIDAQFIEHEKKKYDALTLTSAEMEQIEELHSQPDIYEKLAKSIAPEIYGMEDVKKALLLLLVGGVTKEMGDGMRIRGDINICLMGDPGVAKSQLLKYISKVAPRGVYTTGRGSSGVGLTAAVMRDPVTDEMVLEGGALVLADNGVCAIDEFDKMDDTDRTAIHEVMEQQTISIAKAGISTTLNARTSILAAANPLYGRYNPRLSPVENINLPAALLSRFDLVFLLLDTPTRESDIQLARHVTLVHQTLETPDLGFDPLSPAIINQYISRARQFRPTCPKEVADSVVAAYVKMRQAHKRDANTERQFSHVTPRTFLGVMRLAQAHSRLRFSQTVAYQDVEEALRLLEVCKASLTSPEDGPNGRTDHSDFDADATVQSKIYRVIRDLAFGDGSRFVSSWDMETVRNRVFTKGFTDEQLQATLTEYADLQLWQVVDNGARLEFIS